MKKLIILFCLVIPFLFTKRAQAYMYNSQQETAQLVVDKKVKPIEENEWRDNLTPNDTLFPVESLVDFQIMVKNTGEEELKNIEITDSFPEEIKYIFGPGEFSSETNQLKWKIDSLAPGEEKEFHLRGQIKKDSNLPENDTICVLNMAHAKAENGLEDKDTAQLCITTKILGEKYPETGNPLVLYSLVFLATAGLGIISRNFARGKFLAR